MVTASLDWVLAQSFEGSGMVFASFCMVWGWQWQDFGIVLVFVHGVCVGGWVRGGGAETFYFIMLLECPILKKNIRSAERNRASRRVGARNNPHAALI